MKCKYFIALLLLISLLVSSPLKAGEYVDSLKMLILKLEQDNLTDSVLNTRFELIKYVRDSDYDLFLELASQNILLAKEHDKNWALIDVYMEMGEVLSTKGIFSGALVHLNHAMNLAVKDEYRAYVGWINVAIGNAYNGMSNYSKSLEFYHSALKVFDQENSIEGIGLAATNLGTNYRLLNNQEKAEHFFKMGLNYHEKLGDAIQLGYTHMYYCDFKISQGKYIEAQTMLNELLDSLNYPMESTQKNFQFLEAKVLQAEILTLLAECERQKGDVENEFLYLQKAVDIYQNIGDDLHLSFILNRIGWRYFETARYGKALEYADFALDVAEKSVVLTEQASSLKLKADAFASLGKSESALESYKAYKILNDSIYNSAVIQAISNVDVLMNSMEKEKDIQILSLKIEHNKKMRTLIIGIAILVILLIFGYVIILFQKYKKGKKITLLLREKNTRIFEQAANLEMLNGKLLHLNKSKDRFHAIIAHDLKNPVVAFYSLFSLLKDSYDTFSEAERKSFIEMAYLEVERISKLLDNLLTWSRIQGGHLVISKEKFFIDEAINEIVGSLTMMAGLKNISFEVCQIEHIEISADKEMITAVVRNLCTNAVKFTRKGEKIQIGVKKWDQFIEVWVKDYGIGIPKDQINELFEIGSRSQRKGTHDEPGTGLGLQLCSEFIKLHEGNITVESEEGIGSRFAFNLPIDGVQH